VQYRDSSTSSEFVSRSFGANILSATLDNLVPFVDYELRVSAENVAGSSAPSNSLMERTHPAGKKNVLKGK
jgi:hypothetical protein